MQISFLLMQYELFKLKSQILDLVTFISQYLYQIKQYLF